MMLFLFDQGLPRSVVAILSRRGIEAEHVGDLGWAEATDEQILERARSRGAIVVAPLS